jgi:hypothetical protein
MGFMKRRQWTFALVAGALAAGVACQRSTHTAPATGESPAASAASASPEAGSWRAFEPPADGRLTTAQVEMYLAVRRQATAPLKDSPGAGQLVDAAASLQRTVREQGQDADEYRWVSARVAEASPPDSEALGGLAGTIEAAGRRGREQVLEAAARERVPVAPGAPAPDDAARVSNRQLLERYRSELDALRPPAARPSAPTVPPSS